MAKILSYEEKDTWIHRLSGVTKLIFFLLWCLTSMLTYDTRVLAVMLALALIIFKASRTQWKQVGAVFKLVLVFLVFNVVAIYLFPRIRGRKSMVPGRCFFISPGAMISRRSSFSMS